MADRSIYPLSTYYAALAFPRKNDKCDTRIPSLPSIYTSVILILGQIHTQHKHTLCGWGLTVYSCFTHSPRSGGEAIHSNKGYKWGEWMDILLDRFNLCLGLLFVVRGAQLNYAHICTTCAPMQHISYLKTSSLYIQQHANR